MRILNKSISLGVVTLIPFIWTACSPVDFSTHTDLIKPSCSESGADLTACVNNDFDFTQMSQSIDVKANADVDILFVVDNSSSMSQEQVGIGDKINGFIDKIKDLNWQIALTTTDERVMTTGPDGAERPWGDGQLRPFDSDNGNQFVMRSTDLASRNAQSMLANAINVGVSGNGNERGINATYRSVARAADPSPNKDFFRPDAKLAVVIITDEDECSSGLGVCANKSAATASHSDPKTALNFIKSQLGASKVVSFNSIMFIPNDSTCKTGANQGHVYKEIVELTNGVTGSICSSDFTTPLAEIGNKVVELIKSVSLACAPADIDKDGKVDLAIVLADGSTMTSGFQINGSTVNFASALPEGRHDFHYFCK